MPHTHYASAPVEIDARAELIGLHSRHVDIAEMLCDCGSPVAPRSCYCQKCEDEIYADEGIEA